MEQHPIQHKQELTDAHYDIVYGLLEAARVKINLEIGKFFFYIQSRISYEVTEDVPSIGIYPLNRGKQLVIRINPNFVNRKFHPAFIGGNPVGIDNAPPMGVNRSSGDLFAGVKIADISLINTPFAIMLYHQLLHVILKHPFRGQSFQNKEIFYLATDLVANNILLESQLEYLPAGMEHTKCYPHIKFPANMSVDECYRILMETLNEIARKMSGAVSKAQKNTTGGQKQNGQQKGTQSGQQKGQKSGVQGGQQKSQENGGQDGQEEDNGSGENGNGDSSSDNSQGANDDIDNNPLLNDSEKRLAKYIKRSNKQKKGQGQGQAQGQGQGQGDGENEGEGDGYSDDHNGWDEFDKLSETTRKMYETFIEDAILDAARNTRSDSQQWGRVPMGVKEAIDEIENGRKPTLNWRTEFRRLVGNASRSAIKNTINRVSKRFNTRPGSRIKRKCNIAIAIDTSGSVSNEALAEFFHEIKHIYRNTGAVIYVFECDAAVGTIYQYKGKTPEGVTGRGGTDFEPAIAAINDHHITFDVFIQLTDGFCNVPERKPKAKKCYWVITPDGVNAQEFYTQYSENLVGARVIQMTYPTKG